MLGSLQSPIAVVAHDAGAANHIIAWLKNADCNHVHACLTGPALALWRHAFPCIPIGDLTDTVAKSRTLISGTGWGSSLEHDSRKMACQLSIKSIAVIDHWTNYRERFIRGGVEILPNEIWLTDEYAKKLAESEFANLKIVQLPNLYLDDLVQQVRQHERVRVNRTGKGNNLLYVLEPIRQAWGAGEVAGEFMGLECFVKNMGLLQLGSDLSIRLRPHPSDPAGKYDQWIEGQNNLEISLDDSLTLAEAIAWSDIVVGCQTYAMVVALVAGRRVISSIPCWAPPCVLPQAGIIKLSELLPPNIAAANVISLKN
jgi:hypothetical protein